MPDTLPGVSWCGDWQKALAKEGGVASNSEWSATNNSRMNVVDRLGAPALQHLLPL